MRRFSPGRIGVVLAFSALAFVVFPLSRVGADSKSKGMPNLKKEVLPKGDETVRDLAYVRVNDTVRVEGVGLVIGLDGTGSNPEPGAVRSKLLDRMRKAGVENAEKWLESPTTSLVLVKGTIPAGVTKSDHWDVQIELTPTSTTRSLAGGYLMMTPLTVVQIVDGQSMTGQEIASAYGPVLIPNDSDPRTGRVLGGARSKKDLPHLLVLKEGRQGYRTADLLQKVISQRFHQRKGVEQIGLAVAKTPDHLMLSVPKVYHDNQFRYFQVIERLHMIESADLRARRMAQWSQELLDLRTAGNAALKLEGVGRNAVDSLKPGLASTHPQVRFFAAEALAYLNDPSGVDVLAKAAIEQEEFRAFAFAALAALDDPASSIRLRNLMSEADPKVRYGAFCALKTLDPRDPFLGRSRVLQDEREQPDDEGDDAMALRLHSAPRRKAPRVEDPFELFVVQCEGPPSVHVSRSRRCEIVIFGRGQKLLTPVVLGGSGPYLLNATVDQSKIEISRIGSSGSDATDLKTTSSADLGNVIQSLANLGASYPDILGVLEGAKIQKNLEGPLVVDALPTPTKGYESAQLAGTDATAKKDDAVGKAGLETQSNAPRKGLLERLHLRRP